MFEAKDKTGQTIYIKDTVVADVEQTDMFGDGETEEVEAIVVALLNETQVQIQPEEGASFVALASHVKVTKSLIGDVYRLATAKDMKELIEFAEKRYADECKNGTNKKKSTAKKSTVAAKPKSTGTFKL
ncbi:hypothetical protein N9878_00465 [bacterium]|nr:hypothetical protein [bacterium]